jgi:hypothetical protein
LLVTGRALVLIEAVPPVRFRREQKRPKIESHGLEPARAQWPKHTTEAAQLATALDVGAGARVGQHRDFSGVLGTRITEGLDQA